MITFAARDAAVAAAVAVEVEFNCSTKSAIELMPLR